MLLILAGVTLKLVVGKNGLFTKAKESREKTEYANALEKVNLAIGASYENDGKLSKELLKENLNKIKGLEEQVEEINYDLEIIVDRYKFKITENGKITLIAKATTSGLSAADIKANPYTYYGKYVNYSKEGINNWRIFYVGKDKYADDGVDHIFITTTNVIGDDIYLSSIGYSSRNLAVEGLKNPDDINWSKYKDETKADWAHGGITYEMFRDSYNDVGGTQDLIVDSWGKVKYKSNTVDSRQDNLYLLVSNYWLASADVDHDNDLVAVLNSGKIDTNAHIKYNSNAIRPLVCLKSGAQLVRNGNAYDIVVTE